MYNATEQFAEISKAGYDNAMKIASLSIEKAERLLNLNLQSAKLALAQSMTGASAATEVKDVQDLLALRTKLAETGVQYATAYSRGVYEVASETQADFTALAEEAWSAYTKGVAAWVEKATQNAPAGSDVAVTALKSTVAATTAAFDQFQRVSR